LLTVSQAGEAVSLSVSTVQAFIRLAALVSVRIGGAGGVPVEALDEFLDARAVS